MGVLLVLNIHGTINVPGRTRSALKELRVERRFSATVIPNDPTTIGTLKKCKDYVAWSTIDQKLLASLLRHRGRISQRKPLDGKSLIKLGYKNHDDLALRIIDKSMKLSSIVGLRPFFTLHPPKGGFKGFTKKSYTEKGVLGENPELSKIVRRMI